VEPIRNRAATTYEAMVSPASSERHAAFDIADSPPRIQPRAEGSERGQIALTRVASSV